MEFFRNKWVVVMVFFGGAFFVGAQYPRDTISKDAWGYPFVYRWIIKAEYRFSDQPYSYFSVFFLLLDVLILFVAAICAWYFLSWLVWKIRVIIYRLQV